MEFKKGQTGMWTVIVIGVLLILAVGAVIYYALTPSGTVVNNLTTNQSNQNNQNQTSGQTYSVSIQNMSFRPATISVASGDTIIWTNNDSVAHTVTSNSGSELNSGTIQPGEVYIHTFTTGGAYPYHCSIHPFMTGTVNVGTSGNSAFSENVTENGSVSSNTTNTSNFTQNYSSSGSSGY